VLARLAETWRFSVLASARARVDDRPVATTVLIVDDHAGFRLAARALLERQGFEVVGEAGDGASGIRAAAELAPVVLLDVQLPDLDGFDVAARLARLKPAPAVLLTSTRDSSEFGQLIAGSTARGFIPKAEITGARISSLLS
jgi:DNA-binding NarL/FixJ family response regulator